MGRPDKGRRRGLPGRSVIRPVWRQPRYDPSSDPGACDRESVGGAPWPRDVRQAAALSLGQFPVLPQERTVALAKCFVVMPVSTPEMWVQRYNDQEHFRHVLNHLFTPALTSVNYEVVPPTASGSDLIHAEIIKNLEECELVLCDISTSNPNVFFELGIRTSLDRPIVLVRDNFTTQIPFDTGSINTYTYESSLQPWILESQISGLAKHITEAAEKSGDRNSLWRYFGLTQRATPAEVTDPTQAKLDLLIGEVTRLANTAGTPKLEDYGSEQLGALAAHRRLTEMQARQLQVEDDLRRTKELERKFDVPNRVRNLTFSNIPPGDVERIVERRNVLNGDIPSKYRDCSHEFSRILMEVSSIASVKYDTIQDVILIESSGVITQTQAEKVAQAAEKSSIKYILKASVYE